MDWKLTVGIEVHAELKTRSKMFCGCVNDPEEARPNHHICPVCTAQPGSLPVINKEAVRHVLRVGKALGGTLADVTEFDRKNYFYPDIPKGYQISQYKYPLVSGGKLRGVEITRIHLEEDTARSSHDEGDYSLVDFNRAGVPLMELVTEPVIHSAKDAADFARELQLLFQYLGVSDANMEKGQMRVEANISISKDNTFGTKVEVKNLNSFRAVERAIEYEIKRQSRLLEKGESVLQETRGWNEAKQETFSQRKKEGAQDYRYFPDPDLPKLKLSEIEEFNIENLEVGELPEEKRVRYRKEFGIKEDDIEVFVSQPKLAIYFENIVLLCKGDSEKIKLASNYILSDMVGLSTEFGNIFERISAEQLVDIVDMIQKGELSSRGAKDTLRFLAEGFSGTVQALVEERGLVQKNDMGALEAIVLEVIQNNPGPVSEYKAGKEASIQFLVGQCMKASKGSGNPKIILDLLKQKLL